MGRKTWDSLPVKPLPNRENVVITSIEGLIEGPDVVGDMHSIKKILPQMNFKKNVWVIGGASIFEQLLPYMDEIWLSRIHGTYNCDTFLPITLIEEKYRLHVSEMRDDIYMEIWEKR